MIPNQVTNDVESNGLGTSTEFSFTGGAMLVNVLKSTYQDPISANIQEYCQNASEVDKNFTVHLPTMLEPWLGIIDKGTGLSKEDTPTYFSGVGASTKSDNNTSVGGFGIGCKVGFAMSDQYTVISRYEGMSYTFAAYIDEKNIPQFTIMSESETTEHNGIEVRVPVDSDDFDKVRAKMIEKLCYFDPKPSCNVEVDWVVPEYYAVGDDWAMKAKKEPPRHGYRQGYGYGTSRTQSRIIMGNLWYPINTDKVTTERYGNTARVLNEGVDITVPIGSIQLPLSRESIVYSPATIKVITDKCEVIAEAFIKTVQDEINTQPNLYQALRVHESSSGLVNSLTDVKLTYKGEDLARTMHTNTVVEAYAMVGRHDLRKKTMNFSDLQYNTMNMHGVRQARIKYEGDVDPVCIMYSDLDKKIPSRLLNYMKTTHLDKQALMFKYTPATEHQVRKWIFTTYGWKSEVKLFSVDVPDYKIQRAATQRKVAGVKEMRRERYGGVWSYDLVEVDLDVNTGIYVDMRRGEMSPTVYTYNEGCVKSIVDILERHSFLPKGTKIYGCPGSHKNKMKDHANWMSIDEVIEQAFDVGSSTINKTELGRFTYLNSLQRWVSRHPDIFMLDIDVKGSYYNTIKTTLNNDNDYYNSNSYQNYTGLRQLQQIIMKGERYKQYNLAHDDVISTKFFSRYPLLQYTGVPTDKGNLINEYINLKETCYV